MARNPAKRRSDANDDDDRQSQPSQERDLTRDSRRRERRRSWLRRHWIWVSSASVAGAMLFSIVAWFVVSGIQARATLAQKEAELKEKEQEFAETEKKRQVENAAVDLRRQAAVFFQQKRYDRGMLLLARALELAEQVDDALAQQVRLELAECDRMLLHLRLALPTKEELNGFTADSRIAVTLAPDLEKKPFEERYAFVRLWDLATRQPLGKPIRRGGGAGAQSRYRYRGVVPGGETVVVRLDDNTLQLCRSETGEPIGELLWHKARCYSWALNPDGKRLLTTSAKEVRFWDTQTSRLIGEPWTLNEAIALSDSAVAFRPDGGAILFVTSAQKPKGGFQNAAEFRDVRTGQLLFPPVLLKYASYGPSYLFSPDSRLLALQTDSKSIQLYDAQAATRYGQLLEHPHYLRRFVFSLDSRTLLTTMQPETKSSNAGAKKSPLAPQAQVWDVGGGEPAIRTPARDYPGLELFSPDGRTLLTREDKRSLRLWDALTGRPVGALIQTDGRISRTVFNPTGSLLFVSSETELGGDKIGRLYDTATGQPVGQPLPNTAFREQFDFSPDGRLLRVHNGTFDTIDQVWDLERKQALALKRIFELGSIDRCVVGFGKDGATVEARNDERKVFCWDAGTGQLLRIAGPPRHTTYRGSSFVASPDGTWLLTSKDDGKDIGIWDLDRQLSVGELLRHTAQVRAAAISADKKTVVTAAGNDVNVWDATTGKLRHGPLKHTERVTAVAISPDGSLLATASGEKDCSVSLWNAATGRQLPTTLKPSEAGFARTLTRINFSPTGNFLVVGSALGTTLEKGYGRSFQVWVTATGQLFGVDPVQSGGKGPSTIYETVTFGPGDNVILLANFPDRDPEAPNPPARVYRLWDGTTGKPIGGRIGPLVRWDPFSNLYSFTTPFTPDGKAVFIADAKAGRLWEAATGKPLGLPLVCDKHFRPVAFSPDGRRLLLRVSNDDLEIHPAPARCPGDAKGIKSLVEAATGLELADDGNTFKMLDGAAWQKRWRNSNLAAARDSR